MNVPVLLPSQATIQSAIESAAERLGYTIRTDQLHAVQEFVKCKDVQSAIESMQQSVLAAYDAEPINPAGRQYKGQFVKWTKDVLVSLLSW